MSKKECFWDLLNTLINLEVREERAFYLQTLFPNEISNDIPTIDREPILPIPFCNCDYFQGKVLRSRQALICPHIIDLLLK